MYHRSGFAFALKTSFLLNFLAWCNFKLEIHGRVGSWLQIFRVFYLKPRWKWDSLFFCACRWSFVSSLPSSEDRAFQRFWLDRILTYPQLPSLAPYPQGHSLMYLRVSQTGTVLNWAQARGVPRIISGLHHLLSISVSNIHLKKLLYILFSMSRCSAVWIFSHYLAFYIVKNTTVFYLTWMLPLSVSAPYTKWRTE